MVGFDLGSLLQGQTTIAKLRSADNLLIIGPSGLQYETQVIGGHGLGIFWCFQILPWAPPSKSNDGSLALVSCLFSGYKFASVL